MNPQEKSSKTDAGREESDKGRISLPAFLDLKNILVPIDFSKTARKALEYAVPFAKYFGARITLVHIIEPLPYPTDITYGASTDAFPVNTRKEELAALARETLNPEFVNEVIVHVGQPFDIITKVARDLGVDLIIITTHGYTGLKHVLMGSTAERIVRHAPCPVLVVRRGDGENA